MTVEPHYLKDINLMQPLIPFFFAAFCATAAFAADPTPQKPGAAARADAGQAINTVCPVSGDIVGSVGKPVYAEYHGKKIAFCCRDCAKKFYKNPDKYGALAEKNQSANEGL
jgi:YHS domain-containing protein